MISKNKLKEYVYESGIDLVGVAPIERFEKIEPQNNPLSIFPTAKAVISVALEIPRGVYRGIEEGALWTRAPRQIDANKMYRLARFIENEGAVAVPCSPLSNNRWPEGIKFRSGKIEPNVYPSLEYAAVVSGLGEIGFCGLFLTPQYGIRQALGMIITDADLETDQVFLDKICDRQACARCINACPLDAICRDKVKEIDVYGNKYEVAEINFNKCTRCPNGTFPDTTGGIIPNRQTSACARECLVYLEESSKLEKKYINPFRRREKWGIKLGNE